MIHLRYYARSFSLVCYGVSHRSFLLFSFFNYYYDHYFVFAFVFVFFVVVDKERKKSERQI